MTSKRYWLRNPQPGSWIAVSKRSFVAAQAASPRGLDKTPVNFVGSELEGRITEDGIPPPSDHLEAAYQDLALMYGQLSTVHQLMVDLGIAINEVNFRLSEIKPPNSNDWLKSISELEKAMDEVNSTYVEFQAELMKLGREQSE